MRRQTIKQVKNKLEEAARTIDTFIFMMDELPKDKQAIAREVFATDSKADMLRVLANLIDSMEKNENAIEER